MVFSTDHIKFKSDGSVNILLHRIKNDYTRDGFDVVLQPSKCPKLDPMSALKTYIMYSDYASIKQGSILIINFSTRNY